MKEQKTIGIATFKALRLYGSSYWDPDSIKTGITGSEEAIIYIAQSLANLGYKVIVYGDPPPGSVHSLPDANPRYLDCDTPTFDAPLDILVSWRMPQYGVNFRRIAKKVYLWPHDSMNIHTCHLTDEEINQFDDVLWLSEWQRKNYISHHPSFAKFTKIFGNGINPNQFKPIQERANPYSCIYSSSWSRGLSILLNIWPKVKKQYPQATLDIYYGPQGLNPTETESFLKKIHSLEDVINHGLVGHEELNRAYERSSLWTYPCTGGETFCITGLRAQMAGAIPVIQECCALPETVPFGYKCSNEKEYLEIVLKAMENAEKISMQSRQEMREFVLNEFTWDKIALKWKSLFENDLASYENKKEYTEVFFVPHGHVIDKEAYLQDAEIVKKALRENPNNSSYIYHIAVSYKRAGENALALEYFEKRALIEDGDKYEVYNSLYEISKLQEELKFPPDTIINSYLNTFLFCSFRSEPICCLTNYLMKEEMFLLGYLTSQLGLSLSFVDEYSLPWIHEWGHLSQYADCAYRIGKHEEAQQALQKLLSIQSLPFVKHMAVENNLRLLKKEMSSQSM